MPHKLFATLSFLAILAVGSTASAGPIVEIGDAGQLLGTEQLVPSGTTSIIGVVETNGADLFLFGWGGGMLTVDAIGSDFDTQLFLFTEDGFGIVHDDDAGPGLISLFSVMLAPGNYLVGISEYNLDPVSAGGAIFPTGVGTFGPTGPGGGQPLSGWQQFSGPGGGNYVINFSAPTTAVPEPSSVVLLGLALGGLAVRRFRHKNG